MRDDLYYVLTHVILTNYYSQEDASTSLKGLGQDERRWLADNIMPIDDPSFGFGNGNESTFVGRCFARRGEVPSTFECFSINSGKPTQTIVGFVATGDAKLAKVSAEHSISDFNTLYSMQGLTYDIFTDPSCSHNVGSFELDSNGNSPSFTASKGTYYVRERQSSCESSGFAYDPTVHEVRIEPGRTTTLRVSDPPQYARPRAIISKIDAETRMQEPLGAASLEGALFRVKFYGGLFDSAEAADSSGSLLRSWLMSTDEHGDVIFDADHLVSGDAPYLNSSGEMVLPLGTATICEEAPPNGYLLNESVTHILKIEPSGTDTIVSTDAIPEHPDQVKRGDLEFVKASEADMSRLANVAFRLTSTTTGEAHILVTDENGYFSSRSDWNPHTSDTNRNDSLPEGEWRNECGIWFGSHGDGGLTDPDDSLGALPYDTYDLEELPCMANSNCELITIRNISIKRDNVCVDLGTIDDPMKQTQYISSRAYDGIDLDKTFTRCSNARLVDAIDFTNLIPGQTYTLRTRLVYRHTGSDVCDNGSPVTAQKTFIADSANGKANVELEFSTAALESDSVVFFETLYKDDTLIAQDCDLNNPDQTLYLEEPWIKTRAYDPTDDDKTISADRNSTIIDSVSYSGLVAGQAYSLEGDLMIVMHDDDGTIRTLPATDKDMEPITSHIDFTPTSSSGSIDVVFQFDGMLFDDDTTLVVFEMLYQDGMTICEHRDANDADQTVSIERPSIDSHAYDATSNTKVVAIDDTMRIEDKVSYKGLVANETYTLTGTLMDPTSATAYGSDELCSTTTFTPTSSSGETVVTFELAGIPTDEEPRNIVVFEQLAHNGEAIAEHADPTDVDQTVVLMAPSIHTEALDRTDGDHEIAALENRSIVDTVFYEALMPGKEYAMHGVLMDGQTGEPLLIDGMPIESDTLFTPNSSTGHMEMRFDLNAKTLKDKDIVVFESLYKDGILIAQHADIQSDAQTIHVTNNDGSPLPRTGDMLSDPKGILIASILLVLLGVGAHLLRRRRACSIVDQGPDIRTKHERLMDSLYER